MANNADNIHIVRPKTAGAAFVGGNVATDVTTQLTGESLGWLHSDGIDFKIGKDTKDIKAFGGDTVLTIQTAHDVEVTMKALEFTNPAVLKGIFGEDNVVMAGDKLSTVKVNGDELPVQPWTLDMRGMNGRLIRIVMPKAKPTGDIELKFGTDDPIAPSFTLNAYPDADGVKAYIYFGEEA